MSKQILTFGRYLKAKYKQRIKKVPISLSGFTCPNIDGFLAKGGCTYCDNSSFSPNLSSSSKSLYLSNRSKENPILDLQLKELKQQFNKTARFFKQSYKINKYIVYFQSFSNSYAPVETLEVLYKKALSFKNVIGLSIGTRADCLSDEFLDLLVRLGKNKEIWLEIGVQSIFDKTLKFINRAEKYQDIKAWILKARAKNIQVCAHLIYGLPNESVENCLESFKEVTSLGVNSIKIHPLYIVTNTRLEIMHKENKLSLLSQDDYIKALLKSLEILPENISVQRITAGIDNQTLITPAWVKDKNKAIKTIKKALKEKNLIY